MARHKLAHAARKHRAQRRDVGRVAGTAVEEWALTGGAPSPSRVAVGRELLAAVRQRLSAEERQVADLRGQGHAWAEIATRLGGTADARRVQLSRALDRVSRELGLDQAEE
jgi:RNA polymerase sigma-70 factor (ECF subfamily)